MTIYFKSIGYEPKKIENNLDGAILNGIIQRVNNQFCKLTGTISGDIIKKCDICSEDNKFIFEYNIDYMLVDGIYNKDIEDDNIIIEFDEVIDFDYVIQSELESIKCDYYKCKVCK